MGVVPIILLWGKTTAEHRDAFNAGWRSTAAILAIFAIFLTTSRLRLSQREHQRQLVADEATRQDATARQITELATRASEQLGAENAATRIGGLNALERLAQSYPDLRQMVVDQICSYLRRPFIPPLERARTLERDTASLVTPNSQTLSRDRTRNHDEFVIDYAEFDVRRVAQTILHRHLAWPIAVVDRPETFWSEIAIDLRHAVLIDFDMGYCRVHFADFADADLHGTTTFSGSIFTSVARFDGTRFGGKAEFHDVTFRERAEFTHATFGGDAAFSSTRFLRDASFEETIFVGVANFGGSNYFLGDGHLHNGDTKVEDPGAQFNGFATFRKAIFRNHADFEQVIFKGLTYFQGATFFEVADFDDATFVQNSSFTISFGNANTITANKSTVDLGYTQILRDAIVLNPGRHHYWPPGWQLISDDPDESYLIFIIGDGISTSTRKKADPDSTTT